jgi:nucleotide-binding universal stress UspA family protein
MTRIQTVLVGADGSKTASRAVASAAEMASKTGAVLHIVMAYKAPSVRKLQAQRASLPEEFRWSVTADSEAQHIVRNAAEHASKMGVKVETHLATGNPAKVILKSAQDLGADIVVVGVQADRTQDPQERDPGRRPGRPTGAHDLSTKRPSLRFRPWAPSIRATSPDSQVTRRCQRMTAGQHFENSFASFRTNGRYDSDRRQHGS